MGEEQDDSLPGAGRLGDDIFHGDIALGSGGVEIVLIDFAAGGFQLGKDVILGAMQSFRGWGARTEADEFRDVAIGEGAIETSRLIGGRRGFGRFLRRRRLSSG